MRSRKVLCIFGMVMAVLLGLAGMLWTQRGLAAGAGDAGSAKAEVTIDNFSFNPQSLTVAIGTTVTWTNKDDVPHTVVSDDKATFRSKALDTDEHFSFTFTKAGTYSYFCSVHPKMTGEIVVK
jgi:plastocyanin